LLFALDQGVDSKRRERVLPRRMYVVDPAAGALVADVELGPPSAAWDGETIGVLPAPDHSRYCILERRGIAVLDGKATKLLGTIPLPRDPGGMLFLNPPNRAYVYHQDSSVVSVVDLEKQLALVDITTGRKGARVGKWAAAIAVALLAPGMSGDVLRSVMADTETWGVVTPDGKTVFLANSKSWDVTVVDTATNQVLETFGGSPPRLLADGRTVAAPEAWGLSLYDVVEHKLLAPLPLAEGGSVCPDGRHVWTGQSQFGGGVHRIDVEQRMVEKPLLGAKGVALFFVVSHSSSSGR
jgi:YVTN family beta-propeller protein